MIATLSKINVQLSDKKSDLTNYSILRKINEKLEPLRTSKLNQVSRYVQFRNIKTITLFLRDLKLAEVLQHKELIFLREVNQIWQKKFEQILMTCIKSNFDITELRELVEDKVELWLALKASGVESYKNGWLWDQVCESLILTFGTQKKGI